MFTTQQYKLFDNSKDFEKIFIKSHSEILKNYNISLNNLKSNYIDPAINNRTIIIGYEDNKPIGYQFINIKNRVINSSFTYIDPNYRKKGYGNLIRLKTLETFKDKFDKVYGSIFNVNYSSLISCRKLAEKLGLKLKEDGIVNDENHNAIAKNFKISINE